MRRLIHADIAGKSPRPLILRVAILLGAVVLIGGHGVLFYTMRAHISLSVGALAVLMLLVFVKHLGWLAPLFGRFRRHSDASPAPDPGGKTDNP